MAENEPERPESQATSPGVKKPVPIPDSIRRTLNLKEDKDEILVNLADEENAVLICAIAPYMSMRISPVQEVSASIGLHEEFAFEAIIDELSSNGYKNYKLMLLLNSPGGGLHSSFKVARAIRQSFKTIEVYVPHMAASGGTLIALAGDKIVMGTMSQLSPLDPQIFWKGRQISALSGENAYNRLCRVFETKTKEEAPYPAQALADQLDPFILEDWNCVIQTAEQYVEEILKMAHYENPGWLADQLIHRFADHDSDINVDRAKALGIRVEKNDDSPRSQEIWRVFRSWLGSFLFLEAGTHVIRYVVPKKRGDNDASDAQSN